MTSCPMNTTHHRGTFVITSLFSLTSDPDADGHRRGINIINLGNSHNTTQKYQFLQKPGAIFGVSRILTLFRYTATINI